MYLELESKAKAKKINKKLKIKLIGLIFLLMGSSTLIACKGNTSRFLHDRSEDYKCTITYPELVIPQGIHSETFHDSYIIPNIS